MENQVTPEKKKKSLIRTVVVSIVLIVGVIFGYKKISYALSHESTDNAQVETQITPVLPRVAGYVKTIAINDYDSVKTGQLVVELDDAELQTQLLQMEADVKASEADIQNAKASLNSTVVGLDVNKGDISLSKVKLQQATEDYNRNKNLFADQAITKKQLDDSRFAYEQALQQEQNSHTDLGSAQSHISVIQASIKKAEAALDAKKAAIEQQKLKISWTKIYAPQAGKIGKRNITLGQFVQAGTPLFSIVNDTTYWIVANFKETQIKHFHEGMPLEFELDAYPGEKIEGSIESLSEATGARFSLLPPDNASGNFVKVTQRVPVKIAIKDINKYRGILRAGLSADVSVPVK
ncbi:membrane fusion protein, multidrug efflux system [Filimonas lacunae]|uniref:Membrane fusion protein, multidrug efflux system n=1 Tax=Filimonas lacunae TaxID=477680 RepID=A0A173MLA7_9BACT|nr:HlyD family secretion protein [Filimonas lacunae]BAV08256.1 membrane fusion component of tripartite multidrug resistance system [Filimonas lacunae]SIT33181.1 membrane fusion protein, multidrug efflux system [Filimonas lacunae]